MLQRLILLLPLWLAVPWSPAFAQDVNIEIKGVSGDVRDTILANLSLSRQKDDPLLSESLIRRLFRRGQEEIRTALEPFGYYRAKVESDLRRENDTFTAIYTVEPGKPIRLAEVDINIVGPGSDDLMLQRWRREYPLRKGDVLQHEAYEDAKQALLSLAQQRGYIEGELETREIRVDLERYAAEIHLTFRTGPRYRFGDVAFHQDFLNETLLRRYLTFAPGHPYDAGLLLNLQRVLTDTTYFSQIDVRPTTKPNPEHVVPVDVFLTPARRTRYTAGIGYSTDTGPRLSAGMERRWVNRRGHQASAEIETSDLRSSVTTRYRVPLKRPITDSLTYAAGYIDEDTDTSTRETVTLTVEDARRLGSWQRTAGLSLELEDSLVGNTPITSQLLIPYVGVQRVEADDLIHPSRGWRAFAQLKGAAEGIASDTSLLQLRMSGKYIRSISDRGRILARTDLGATWTPEFAELPASQRFFAGGDQSVRGYDYNSLGPVDAEGEVVGGKHLLVASIEYDHQIRERWALAAFYDAGNAFNEGSFSLNQGAGFGVRWRLPFGTVRVDIASAISEPDRPFRLHLTVGSAL